MAADHRPLDTDELISHFEEMPSRVPEEKARGQRGKTRAIRYGVPGIHKRNCTACRESRTGSERSRMAFKDHSLFFRLSSSQMDAYSRLSQSLCGKSVP